MNTYVRSLISALALGGLVTLAGCGGGTGDNPNGGKAFNNSTGGGTSTGTSPGGTAVVPAPVVPPPPVAGVASLVLTLADPTTGSATNTVPAIARAIVRDENGNAVANSVVTFSANPLLAAIVPASGTALTDSTGTATVRVNGATLSSAGATLLTASAVVQTASVSGSIGFAIGPANVALSNFSFGTSPLSPFGTTSVSVTVLSNGLPVTSPQTVSFSSPCATSGKAVLTPSVLTGAGGVAQASYRDNGCAGNDTVTASVSGLASSAATLAISIPTAGSIQFVSATPKSITLKGTGGAGRQETSLVIFKVVDTGGNPLGASQSVSFSLSTSVGGITFANGLTTSTAVSDPLTGQVAVTVQAGTVSTPVRVLAETTAVTGNPLRTQSDQLTITTGIPDQESVSLSASVLNIEGWDWDGEETQVTARLADHFGNPVPDGTAVNFVSEGGSIGSTTGTGSCITTSGTCTMTLTSQNLRPTNGRVAVLAYAVGEETFVDLDGDGYASKVNRVDGRSELVDENGTPSDIGEAFLDSNENGIRDVTETFIDFNNNNTYDVSYDVPAKFNGVLCSEAAQGGTSSAGTCSPQTTLHVFRNLPIVFSGSFPVVRFYERNRATGALTRINPLTGITFNTACDPNVLFEPEQKEILVVLTDVNGNPLPMGTTVDFSRGANFSGGGITGTGFAHVQMNTNACLDNAFKLPGELGADKACPVASAVTPGHPAITFSALWTSTAVQVGTPPGATCIANNLRDALNVRVRTPRQASDNTSGTLFTLTIRD